MVFASRALGFRGMLYLCASHRSLEFLVLCGVREKRANGLRPTKTNCFHNLSMLAALPGGSHVSKKEGEHQSQHPDQKPYQIAEIASLGSLVQLLVLKHQKKS